MSEIPVSALTKELVDSLLDFNPETGAITWKYGLKWVENGGNATVKSRDDLVVYIKRRGYKASRLMWLHVYGEWPKGSLYYKDSDMKNNRISNLEEANSLGADVELTHTRLVEVLRYEPDTGNFYWLIRPSDNVFIGDLAGGIDGKGYGIIRIDDKYFRSHRLAWFYHYGEWPEKDIDHINGDILDNRINNIRDVSKTINMQNQRRAQKGSTSGFLGVSHNKKIGKYVAKIRANGKTSTLGAYATAEEAHTAYVQAKRKLHEGCTI